MKSFKIDYHADDYGISKNSCDDIFSLLNNNYLDSISFLPNMETFDYALQKLNALPEKIRQSLKISVHLNVMEGHCVAEKSLIPDLVDENGFFTVSWKKLLIWNYNPFKKNKIINELSVEIEAQVKKLIQAGIYPSKSIRLDSHQHPHLIPVFYKAMFKAVSKLAGEGYTTEFIRDSRENLHSYFSCRKIYKTFSPVNYIKCLVLNFYSSGFRKYLKKYNLDSQFLCGVMFSGHMDYERLIAVLPGYCSFCKKHNSQLELLFHPGSVLPQEISAEFVKPGFNEFHLSSGREIERTAVTKLNKKEFI